MLVEELLAKALIGKYLKDYQCLYYITGAQNSGGVWNKN